MTIERRAQITTGVLILVIVGTVVTLFWSSRQVGEGIKTIDTTSRAVHSAFMMRALMEEYIEGRNARVLREWERHREALGRALNEVRSELTDEALIKDLKDNYLSVSAFAPKVIGLVSAEDTADRFQDVASTNMLFKLTLLQLEQLVGAAHDLSRVTQSLTLQRRYFVQQIIIAVGFLGLAFIVINVYLMQKSVVQPLKRLSNGAEKIGAGVFTSVPEAKSDDEVGTLNRSFNAMAARLQKRDIALKHARDEIALRLEERSAALQRTTAYNNLLQTIQSVQTQFICNTDPGALFRTLLQDLLTVSESAFGFIGEILHTESGQPYLMDRAITNISWDEESREIYAQFARDRGLEFHNIGGLGGTVILSGEPVISNDPANDPRRSGLPEGHPPLSSFLGLPFHSDGKVIGMAGLANRPGGYDQDLVDFLQPYASTCASIIEAYRNENRRREAEQRLFETNQRLQALMDALPVGISFSDDTSCRRITGNPCLFAQFEMTPGENISASASDTAAPGGFVTYIHNGCEIRDAELPLQRAVGENRLIPAVEPEIRLPSGRRWFAEASGAPVHDGNGNVVGGVAVTVDITERKRAEEALREARNDLEIRVQERTAELVKTNTELEGQIAQRKRAEADLQETLSDLKRSNQDLEHFAYVASHDLQEPLRNVAGALQMFEGRHKGKLDGESDQLIHYAVDSARKMKALITDLLAYSRLTTRGQVFEAVDVQEVLHQSLHNLKSLIVEKSAEITYDRMPTVRGDATQLLQIFQNLISNAVKFGLDKSTKVRVSAQSGPSEWIFSVQDNGIGIEAKHFDRIFVIFQQLNKRGSFEGTGIGLAIVKKIVERHRGRIWVESEVGVGSTFYFTVPTG